MTNTPFYIALAIYAAGMAVLAVELIRTFLEPAPIIPIATPCSGAQPAGGYVSQPSPAPSSTEAR